MRRQQSNNLINAQELLLLTIECFLTGTAVLANHRARAPRYVARDSNVTSGGTKLEVERSGEGEGWERTAVN